MPRYVAMPPPFPYVEWVPGKHRFETRQCSKPIAVHLSNGTKQQKDQHNIGRALHDMLCSDLYADDLVIVAEHQGELQGTREEWKKLFKKRGTNDEPR